MSNPDMSNFSKEEIANAQSYKARDYPEDVDPGVETLVKELLAGVADKWTMLVLDVLDEGETLRFSELARRLAPVSQKMLTQTLRRMERDGLVVRTVYPCVPPKVEYRLSAHGLSLGAAFCGVWVWAIENLSAVQNARRDFDQRTE